MRYSIVSILAALVACGAMVVTLQRTGVVLISAEAAVTAAEKVVEMVHLVALDRDQVAQDKAAVAQDKAEVAQDKAEVARNKVAVAKDKAAVDANTKIALAAQQGAASQMSQATSLVARINQISTSPATAGASVPTTAMAQATAPQSTTKPVAALLLVQELSLPPGAASKLAGPGALSLSDVARRLELPDAVVVAAYKRLQERP